MRRQRVMRAEVQTAVRENQSDSLGAVEAFVPESSGAFSVIGSLKDASVFGETLDEG